MTDDIPTGFYLRDGKPCVTWEYAVTLLLATDRPIRIMGLMCSSHGCLHLAAFRCFWPAPSGERYESKEPKCERCTAMLDRAAEALGFALQVQPVLISDDCRLWTLAEHRERMRREAAEMEARLALDPSAARFAAMELE